MQKLRTLLNAAGKWLWRPRDGNFGYMWADMGRCYRCGAPVEGDGEYCADHAREA